MLVAAVNTERLQPNSSVTGFSSTPSTGKISALSVKFAIATTTTITQP